MRCPTCGTILSRDARYCSNCATAMERCHDDERDPADFGCRHADDRSPDQTPPPRPPRRRYVSAARSSAGVGRIFALVFVVFFLIIFFSAAGMIINNSRRFNRSFEMFESFVPAIQEQFFTVELQPEPDLPEGYTKGK